MVNGRRALNNPPGDADGDSSIILLEVGDRTVGFAVDAVLDMFTARAEELAEREGLPGLDAQLVRAVGRRDSMSFVLLDTDALLRPFLDA